MTGRGPVAVTAAALLLAGVLAGGSSGAESSFTGSVRNATDTTTSGFVRCRDAALTDGAVRLYPLNDNILVTSLVAADLSPANDPAAYQGVLSSTSVSATPCPRDPSNRVVNLDTTHYVSTTNPTKLLSISATADVSEEIWFRTTTDQGVLIGLGSSSTGASATKEFLVVMTSTGQLALCSFNGGGQEIRTSGRYDDGAWHHVVAVQQNGVGTKLYVDGTLRATGAGHANQALSGYLRIGYENTSGYSFGFGSDQSAAHLVGQASYAAFYNTALTAQQVLNHYRAGS